MYHPETMRHLSAEAIIPIQAMQPPAIPDEVRGELTARLVDAIATYAINPTPAHFHRLEAVLLVAGANGHYLESAIYSANRLVDAIHPAS